jgi:hypothetical protein
MVWELQLTAAKPSMQPSLQLTEFAMANLSGAYLDEHIRMLKKYLEPANNGV